uniref:Uncharacterized protein n=1 Tax=Anguilla anguilla TaxID=7936 RepID=A0A0E9REC5_ANGAN
MALRLTHISEQCLAEALKHTVTDFQMNTYVALYLAEQKNKKVVGLAGFFVSLAACQDSTIIGETLYSLMM